MRRLTMTIGDRRPALRLAPAPEPDTSALAGDVDVSGSDIDQRSPAADRLDTATIHDWARTCLPIHLCAVIRNELGRAVEAGVLTLTEAEDLAARLTVVIDQAMGVDSGT
jgi:hypothetical protein